MHNGTSTVHSKTDNNVIFPDCPIMPDPQIHNEKNELWALPDLYLKLPGFPSQADQLISC